MNIKPTFERLLVKVVKEEFTESGLILIKGDDEENHDKTLTVEIIDIGPQCGTIKNNFTVPNFSIGMKCLISKYSGIEVKALSDLILINEKDILAIIQ